MIDATSSQPAPLTATQLEDKICLTLLARIDAAHGKPKELADALSDYGMFTAAQYRRACTVQAYTLTKAPVHAP